ncbi:hypothetical protein V6U81_02180 [Micromonospora sp. CPCC 205711]|uniref:hypothetical protein n=1 Tax=Micromonospora sp. CPCC 205547 TaxID=3122400 RepID=UPI002FF1822E
MAIEDGWVLAGHVERLRGDDGAVDWAGALAAFEAVRPEHCRRVVLTARGWGELWHLDGVEREGVPGTPSAGVRDAGRRPD